MGWDHCPKCLTALSGVEALEHVLNCTGQRAAARRPHSAPQEPVRPVDRDSAGGRVWVVRLLDGYRPLSANHRGHWTARQKAAKKVRAATVDAIRRVGVPPLEFVHIALHVTPPDRNRRDTDNWVPYLLKPAKDALVDADVIPDDTPQYCSWAIHLEEPDGSRSWRHTLRLRDSVLPREGAVR